MSDCVCRTYRGEVSNERNRDKVVGRGVKAKQVGRYIIDGRGRLE